MSFFKKLFGRKNQQESQTSEESLPWIEPTENIWNVRLLDLRPISQQMFSTSQSQQMATNAVSYGTEDGRSFYNQRPKNTRIIKSNLWFPIDGSLAPGVLFKPETMEHKWGIYFDGEYLIFIRSWLREVFVIAKTSQKHDHLIIENIIGEFTEGETEAFTNSFLNFLLISHSLEETIPAPLPKELISNTRSAGLWAFSSYGNMAHIGIFEENFIIPPRGKLRSHSLLHIAVAQSHIQEIENQINNRVNINSLAGDGLATLHWAIAPENTESLLKLLELGADPNIRTTQGATPIMNAAQSNKIEHLKALLKSGALVNAKDDRGFTALHRASEMGRKEIVELLLENGADKNIEAEGHTALTLAKAREKQQIVELLS
ncbi:ankyrin repeat domain-containing protein [Chryseobacterium formosus]|uniref:Ankyrin repeat domain-containing protein n=1 Tax=Chryseobacterium formosus TaxID=1537363 RepID=A0ABT3XXB4_9FLAO|nr:ankyrin repeat domain-containing protein [Chryseobacterium formosus]MCX8526269.1 ankyrin repeat domain-containing protein [Chryseobacterium formosus]